MILNNAKVYNLSQVVQVTDSFKKRELIVESTPENSQYTDYIKFEAVQDKVILFEGLKKGDTVNVEFNLTGRLNNKNGTETCFNSLKAWKVTKVASAAAAPVQAEEVEEEETPF